VLMSTEASGQSTLYDEGACVTGLATSEQLANLAQKVDKVIDTILVLIQQQPARKPTITDPSKRALVSALTCEYSSHVLSLLPVFSCLTFR